MTAATGPRHIDVELRWRAAPLTLALATGSAAALTVAVFGARWQLIAFAAPLLGVLCSIGAQPPVPRIRLRAQPAAQRCFESEPVTLTLCATAHPGTAQLELSPPVHPAVHPAARWQRSRLGADRCAPGAIGWAVTVCAETWGRYPIGVSVTALARGGLLRGTATVEAAEVTVFPLAPPRLTPIPPSELLDRLGAHLTRHTGRGVEYADIRAYVPGDPLRAVNWPVSARRGSLHVTQRHTDRAADVVVLIDSAAQPRGPATEAGERAVRGAAQVVQSALRTGDRAGIVTLGGRRPRWLGVDIGQRQFYRVLDAVLGVDADAGGAQPGVGSLAPRAAVPPGAVIVAFSTLLDAEFTLALIDLRDRGHAVLAVDVLPEHPFEAVSDPLVARLWTLHRAAMYRDMSIAGVDVVAWPDDRPLEQAMRVVTDRRRPRHPEPR